MLGGRRGQYCLTVLITVPRDPEAVNLWSSLWATGCRPAWRRTSVNLRGNIIVWFNTKTTCCDTKHHVTLLNTHPLTPLLDYLVARGLAELQQSPLDLDIFLLWTSRQLEVRVRGELEWHNTAYLTYLPCLAMTLAWSDLILQDRTGTL